MSFDALIVDHNPVSRNYLWQATLADPNFQTVKAVSSLHYAMVSLQSGYKTDVLLISSALDTAEISEFIPEARKTAVGKEAAYVIVLKIKDQETENIATSLVDGTDGLLFEPYSVASLRAVAAIAAKVKAKHEEERTKVALKMVVKDLIPKFDQYAEQTRKKSEATQAKKELLKISHGLKKIGGNHIDAWVEIAAEAFENAPPRPPKEGYKGASERVKAKFKKG